MKVFISQKMRGRSEERILKDREKLKADFRELFPDDNIGFIDSYKSEFKEMPPIKALAKSIELLADANVLYCPENHYDSRGTSIELDVANAYRIPIIFYDSIPFETCNAVPVCGE